MSTTLPLQRAFAVASASSFVVLRVLYEYSEYKDLKFFYNNLGYWSSAAITSAYAFMDAKAAILRYSMIYTNGEITAVPRLLHHPASSILSLPFYMAVSVPSRSMVLLGCLSWIAVGVPEAQQRLSHLQGKRGAALWKAVGTELFPLLAFTIIWVPAFSSFGAVVAAPIIYPLGYMASRVGIRAIMRSV